MKNAIKSLLSSAGLEIRRKDPSLPLLHEIKVDELSFPFWLTNSHAKSWWYKPRLDFNAEFQFLKECAKPEMIGFDIGAHHGMQTVPLAFWAGEKSAIYAFEANKENAITLQANLNLNNLANCRAYYAAVARESGTISISGESVGNSDNQATVTPCYSLDDFCNRNEIDDVDFIKIDVEGFETDVLAGAKNVLSSTPNISLELHIDDLKQYDSSAEEALGMIDWTHYEVTAIDRSHSWTATRPISRLEDLPTSGVANLFFRSKKR